MHRRLGALLAVLALFAGCTSDERAALEGFRDLQAGDVIDYRVGVTQSRTASGLGEPKKLGSSVRLDLEEEATDEAAYALVVQSATGRGEASQVQAAQRLVGRRLLVDLEDAKVGGDAQAFGGAEDVAAGDIGMLFSLFAPVLPSARVGEGEQWRVVTEPVQVPWSITPFTLTMTHQVVGRERFHGDGGGRPRTPGLDAVRVKSTALANVTFRLPIVAPAPAAPGAPASSGSDELIVNQLFDSLFSDIDNPVEGVAAAIAAIPLAVAAPFIAIGEAIGNLFGGSSSSEPEEPPIPVVDLTGPLELRSDTRVWDADGRVLDALGNGTMRLSGRVPDLPGAASELTGKPLTLDVVWKLHRTHASPFPADRDPPGRGPVPLVAVVLLAVAAGLAAGRQVAERRPRHRTAAHGVYPT
jgi:hypothetical protein